MFQAARRRLILPFLLPQIILYTGVTFASIVATVVLALTSWAAANPPRFVGLQNFRTALRDQSFQHTIGNSVYYTICGGVLLLVFATLLALCLNGRFRGRRLYRFLILAPAVISVSVAALMWKWIYNPLFGLVGNPLRSAGRALDYEPLLEGVLRNAGTTLTAVVFTHVWHTMGVWVLLLLAGLERLPPFLLEAARVDGANERQVFFYVTLPLMWDLFRIVIVLWIMTALQAFSYVYLMRSRGVMATYIYSVTFNQWNWAYGMSLATAVMAVIFVIVLFANRLLQREVAEY
jgi:ABC-type sugar transport system permease subunit